MKTTANTVKVSGTCLHCGKSFEATAISLEGLGVADDSEFDCCPDCAEKHAAKQNSEYVKKYGC